MGGSSHTQAELEFERSNWDQARKRFTSNHKDTEQLRLFLKGRMYGPEVKVVCLKLQEDSDNKYHQGLGGILENINALMDIGDLAIKCAPESVGIAWMGIRLCLRAVEGDWSTFQLFSGACADIIGIMISCRVYGKMYGEGTGGNGLSEFQELHTKVVDYIPEIYTDILEFSYDMRKYTDKHKVIRIGKNIFNDVKGQFEAKISKIKESDGKMRDFARTASERMMIHLQRENNRSQDVLRSDVSSLKDILETSLRANEAILRRAFEDLEEERKELRKTPYEKAQDDFESNMNYLDPSPDQYHLLQENLDVRREPGTCRWILDLDEYKQWHDSASSSVIWVSGAGGYGKSILMSTVIELLRAECASSERQLVHYFFCKAGTDLTQTTTRIAKTLVAQLYSHALPLPELLPQANEVVSHALSKQADGNRPSSDFDFATIYTSLLRVMQRDVFLVIDAIDECIDRQDKQLLDNFQRIAATASTKVRIMVCSRPATDIGISLRRVPRVKCEGHNIEDIRKNVTTEMRKFPGWTTSEKNNAVNKIVDKSGGQFKYVQIALDFLRKPLVRPYSLVLDKLPDGLTGSYVSSWYATDEDYLDLLKTALTWTLFADGPVTVPEIMDAYTQAYSPNTGIETELEEYHLAEGEIDLHDRQIRIAGGNFLEVSERREVSLRHLTVKDFFVEQDQSLTLPDENSSSSMTTHEEAFSGLRNSAQRSPWTISAKEAHLEITRILVQNLASPVFQGKYLPLRLVRQERVPAGVSSNDASSEGSDELHGSNEHFEYEHSDEEQQTSDIEVDISEKRTSSASHDHDATSNMQADESSVDVSFNDLAADEDYDFSDASGMDSDYDGGEFNDGLWARRFGDTKSRYEVTHWTYHLFRAQELWSWEEQQSNPSWTTIWKSLTKFMCEDITAFHSWQEIVFEYEGYVVERRDPADTLSDEYKCHGYGTPLQIASIFGLTSLAKLLIDKGHNVNERKLFGWLPFDHDISSKALTRTPLDLATGMGHINVDMVRLCIESGGDLNDLASGSTPFTNAVRHEPSYDFIKYLLDRGAKADIVGDDNLTALHNFSRFGTDPRVLRLLLDAGSVIDVGEHRATPLYLLAARENLPVELLKAYLEAGADVNQENYTSERSLVLLVRHGNYEAVDLMIRYGADIHDEDVDKKTAMHWVAASGNTRTLELLFENGAQVNLPDEWGRTPLLYACQNANEDVARHLLRYLHDRPGMEVNKPDRKGRTPLRQAAARGNSDIVRAILNMVDGPEAINHPDKILGQTSLHKAVHSAGRGTVEILLAHGGDLSVRDAQLLTPMKLCVKAWVKNTSKAALKRLEDTLLLLIEHSKDTRPEEVIHLLFAAVTKGSSKIVEAILEAGIDVDVKDEYGWSPLMLAEHYQNRAIIDILQREVHSNMANPSRWMTSIKSITISDDGLQLQKRDDEASVRNYKTVVANCPIPARRRRYYFEVEVELESLFSIFMGFTNLPTSLDNHLGASSKGYGWTGKWGGLWHQGKERRAYPLYGTGDIVGCAIDFTTQTIFYTKNGQRLEIAFTGVIGRLHPAFTLNDTCTIRANFGGDLIRSPFKWGGWKAWNDGK